MQRDIHASTSVRAPFDRVCSVLRDDPVPILAARPATPDERQSRIFCMPVTASIGGDASLNHDVEVTIGPVSTEPEGYAASIPIEWRPRRHQHLVPDFTGTLHATSDAGSTRIELEGIYTVPLGPIGRFGDTLVGRRIARQSLTDVLERLARQLDTEVDRQMASISFHPAPYPIDLRERPRSQDYIE